MSRSSDYFPRQRKRCYSSPIVVQQVDAISNSALVFDYAAAMHHSQQD